VEHTYLALLWAKLPQETLNGLLEVYNCINVTNAVHVWISEDTRNLNVPVAATEYSSKKYLRFGEL
jgi:serine kinase of HPr protein (carbohydrate metabolism regulator)